MSDPTDMVLVPRAELEQWRARLEDEQFRSTADESNGIRYALREFDAMFQSSAVPVVDEAVAHAITYSSRPDAQCFIETQALWEVPRRGTYHVYLAPEPQEEQGE